jgi:hypothetical protein
MKNQAFSHQNPQAGNVFFVILLGIVLFAALSYAMSGSMRSGTSQLSQEKAKIAAQEMVAYGMKMSNTVKELIISNGCTDTKISFDGATYYSQGTGYTNASSPSSKKCHVFDKAGGNMRLITPGKTANQSYSLIVGVHCYEGQGTGTSPCPNTAKELEYAVIDIPREVCIEINKIAQIGVAGAEPPSDNFSANAGGKFVGTYEPTDNSAFIVYIGASGKEFSCYMDDTGTYAGKYIFSYILLPR